VLSDNREMLKMCRELGFSLSRELGARDVVNVALDLAAAPANSRDERGATPSIAASI
jgi:hypothetical protein